MTVVRRDSASNRRGSHSTLRVLVRATSRRPSRPVTERRSSRQERGSEMAVTRREFISGAAAGAAGLAVGGVVGRIAGGGDNGNGGGGAVEGVSGDVAAIAEARGLTPDNV